MPVLRRVLIIDDEEQFCVILKNNLEQTGQFSVDIAFNAQQGQLLAKQKHPDIILLDVLMPETHGPKLAENLKEDPQTADIPIIFLTAVIAKEELGVDVIRKMGRFHCIAKPVETEELIQCINKIKPGC
ncbi:MAG: response regulator [Candidatus Omnitrophica bacterium]|nr:response regulator [Candidatus Omnitrophota bacterium]